MNYCSAIANGISCASVRSARNFSQILSMSVRTLLDVCADMDADVRSVADECLNKIIRVTSLFLTFFKRIFSIFALKFE